jgi:hypothetical protein
MLALSTSVQTWLLGLVALIVGAVLGHLSGRAADSRRLAAEDARRWVSDRRHLYARFLGLVESLHREADSLACFLPEQPGDWSKPDDEAFLFEESFDWMTRWDDEVQPLLGEVELMATQPVADLAARAAHGILAAVPQSQHLGPDRRHSARRAGRNAMREELGIGPVTNTAPGDPEWPWLPIEQTPESARRRHPSGE